MTARPKTLRSKDLAGTWWERMRQRREALGMQLQEMAGLARIDLGLLSKLERGQRPKPTVAIQVRLARALGTRVDELFGPATDAG